MKKNIMLLASFVCLPILADASSLEKASHRSKKSENSYKNKTERTKKNRNSRNTFAEDEAVEERGQCSRVSWEKHFYYRKNY